MRISFSARRVVCVVLMCGGCTVTRVDEPEQSQSGASMDPVPQSPMSPQPPAAGSAAPGDDDRANDPDRAVDPKPMAPMSVPGEPIVDGPSKPDASAGTVPELDLPDAGPVDPPPPPPPQDPVACSSEAPPPDGSTCTTEGELCAHWNTDPATGYDLYFACHCRAQTSSNLIWYCYENWGGQLVCPHEAPADGSSCFGFKSSTCPYPPQTRCECPVVGDDPRWSCTAAATPIAPTDSVDPEKLVRDLSDEERKHWCEWFLTATVPPGFPLPPDVPVTPDGYYPDRGCMGCAGGVGIDGMLPPGLPVSACMANLALSSCEAKVAELNDCTRSMLSECWPQPRGCARYFEATGCAGTIASRGAQCPIRVE